MSEVFLFRGCDKAYYGDVTEMVADDGSVTLTFGTPKKLFAVKEVGKTTSSDSATQYGDNKALLIINSEGADEISLSGFGLPADVLADITGKYFDESKGMFVNRPREFAYKYLLWREKLTTGKYRYCMAYKGTFNVPDGTTATEDDGTDGNGQELTFTSIFTEKEFGDGQPSKGYFIDTTYVKDPEGFFTTAQDQDTITITPLA